MIRVGILGQGFVGWSGGLDFLRLISSSLWHADAEIEQHVLIPARGPMATLRAGRNWSRRLLSRHAGTEPTVPGMAQVEACFSGSGAHLHAIDYGPWAVASAVTRLNLGVLLPSFLPLRGNVRAPWLGYVYDFQHKRLPHFFSEAERVRRDADFARMLCTADTLIVNAKDVQDDIQRFFPHSAAKVFALPFSPAPDSDWFEQDVGAVMAAYGLQKPYFIICNQFWKHKDHDTAFTAFAAMAQRYPSLALVCTGSTHDFRYPDHFAELMRKAETHGVSTRIHALGLIPKRDQIALVRGAIALIQPTLFEGGPGGGAVYDAVSLGVTSIVSDIAVNREIQEITVRYFAHGNAGSLTHKMEEVIANGPQAAPDDAATLLERGATRRRACGNCLLQAIDYASALYASKSGR